MVSIIKGKVETMITLVPIDDIDFDDTTFKFRLEFTKEELTSLKNSIMRLGLQNPVKLRRKNGKYQIISGWSRLQALKELGYRTAPAEVYHNLSDREAIMISSSDNLHRASLSDLEISNQLYVLYTKYEVPMATLVDWLGGREQRVYDLLKLHSMEERVKSAVHTGSLSLYAAIELDKMPEKLKSAYVEKAIREHWSVRKVKEERRRVEHPFFGVYSEKAIKAYQGLFHALKYVRYPEVDELRQRAWETLDRRMGVPGPHKCETTKAIRALERDPPYVCQNDIRWVVVAKGRVEPHGGDVENPSDDIQRWPAWSFLCDECVRLVFPVVEFHEDVPFTIPLQNLGLVSRTLMSRP